MDSRIAPIEVAPTRASTTAVDLDMKAEMHNRHGKETTVRNVALANAVAKDAPNFKSKTQWTLYSFMALCCMCGIMNGFDGSVMSAVNAMPLFQARFNIGTTGELNGAVFSIYTVGSVLGSLTCGYIMDRWGRRSSMFAGTCLVVLGSVLQASSYHLAQFMIGRFIVGFGNPMAATAAPTYIVEMSYATWRGLAAGLYNALGWSIGANIASWTCYGTNFMSSELSWRIPYIVQCACPAIVIALVWFLPESPRWLFAQDRGEEAAAILVKYHGNKNPQSAVVMLELDEIREAYEKERDIANKNWNYKILFDNRPNLRRVWLIMLVAVFSQFIGGSVISYYLPTMVAGIGVESSSDQLLLNGINTIISFVFSIIGAFFVDKIGRRPLFLWGTFLTGLIYVPLNVLAARAEQMGAKNIPQPQAYAFIAMIFTYGIFWSFCWTPLQALYPAEILNNEIRAKGMGLKGFITGVTGFINTFGTSVALKHIGWRTYTIFLVLHFVHLGLMYLACVETKERTLEELDEIFNDDHPVKRSLQRTQIVVHRGIGVDLKDNV